MTSELPHAELPWVLTALPEDAVLAIVLQLSDHGDVVHFGACCKALYSISEHEILWERLIWLNFKRAYPESRRGLRSSWRQADIEHIVIHLSTAHRERKPQLGPGTGSRREY